MCGLIVLMGFIVFFILAAPWLASAPVLARAGLAAVVVGILVIAMALDYIRQTVGGGTDGQ